MVISLGEHIIRLEQVTKSYPTEPPVVALDSVDLVVSRGEQLAVVGPSGSGKSTLLNVIGCLDRPTSGTYCLDGVEVGTLSDRELARLRCERIGFVFQSFHLLEHRSVVDNVALG
ncbi:MAG TPA: macrolide ABC transporter ATP-binding protein, partial [Acidimicrobiaceae bacterium]|nr:macrolide ABC transporter ATP-binding protein [Acidimicrobiaceae bacterium]